MAMLFKEVKSCAIVAMTLVLKYVSIRHMICNFFSLEVINQAIVWVHLFKSHNKY